MSFANPQPPYPNPQHGQRYEWLVRMYDYKARFYDPRTAMFTNLEPFHGTQFEQSMPLSSKKTREQQFLAMAEANPEFLNPYSYVNWNPTNDWDSDGRIAAWLIATLIIGGAFLLGGLAKVMLTPGGGGLQSFIVGGALVGGATAAGLLLGPGAGISASVIAGAVGAGTTILFFGGVPALESVKGIGALVGTAVIAALAGYESFFVGLVTNSEEIGALVGSVNRALLQFAPLEFGHDFGVSGFENIGSSNDAAGGATVVIGENGDVAVRVGQGLMTPAVPQTPNVSSGVAVSPGGSWVPAPDLTGGWRTKSPALSASFPNFGSNGG